MRINVVGPFKVNHPFATEVAFSKGLRGNGHEVVEFDPNVDDPDVLDRLADFTLVFKTALDYDRILEEMPQVVLYQPDDLRFPHIQEMLRRMRAYSSHLLVFRDYGGEGQPVRDVLSMFATVHTLPLTADPDIYYPEEVERDVDFCFIGSMGDPICHWQRHAMVDLLQGRGHHVLFGQTNDVDEIRRSYRRSRVVLNHAAEPNRSFGWGFGYQCRHFEVGLTRSCLLSNCVMGDERASYLQNFCRFYDDKSFIFWAEALLEDEGTRNNFADQLYEEVLERHSPTVRARQLVDILRSL